MSGGFIAAAGTATVTAAASIYSSNRQAKATRQAAQKQAESAAEANKQQQIAFNRENQNEVDTSAILAANQAGDQPQTMLTGANGAKVDNSLLGGGSKLLGG